MHRLKGAFRKESLLKNGSKPAVTHPARHQRSVQKQHQNHQLLRQRLKAENPYSKQPKLVALKN